MEKKIYNIGVEATMDVIGGKWKPIILCNLRHWKQRPSELRRQISGISQKMLSQELRELERGSHRQPENFNSSRCRVSDYGQTLSKC